MFDTLRVDFKRYYDLFPKPFGRLQHFVFFLSCQGMWALVDYRFRRWVSTRRAWLRLLCVWPAFFGHIVIECLTGISIPTGARIGRGLYIGHFSGIFLHCDVVMGEGCSLSQGVSIGLGGKGSGFGVPTVGDRVYFGAGCKVVGKVTIGSGSAIGANAVVLSSVPEGATAVGVPARMLTREGKSGVEIS